MRDWFGELVDQAYFRRPFGDATGKLRNLYNERLIGPSAFKPVAQNHGANLLHLVRFGAPVLGLQNAATPSNEMLVSRVPERTAPRQRPPARPPALPSETRCDPLVDAQGGELVRPRRPLILERRSSRAYPSHSSASCQVVTVPGLSLRFPLQSSQAVPRDLETRMSRIPKDPAVHSE